MSSSSYKRDNSLQHRPVTGPPVHRTISSSTSSSDRSESRSGSIGHSRSVSHGQASKADPSDGGSTSFGQGHQGGQGMRRKYGPACDACRLRKVKCDASYAENNTAFKEGRRKCVPCTNTGIPCTFQHKARRRGPVPQYVRRLNEEQVPGEPSSSAQQAYSPPPNEATSVPSLSSQLFVQPQLQHRQAAPQEVFVQPNFGHAGGGAPAFSQTSYSPHQHLQARQSTQRHMSLSPHDQNATLTSQTHGMDVEFGRAPRRYSHSTSQSSHSGSHFPGMSPHESYHPYAAGMSAMQRRLESRDSRSLSFNAGLRATSGANVDVSTAHLSIVDHVGMVMATPGQHGMHDPPTDPHWTPSGYINTGVYEEPTPASVNISGAAVREGPSGPGSMEISTGQTNPMSLENDSVRSHHSFSQPAQGLIPSLPAYTHPQASEHNDPPLYNPYYSPSLRFLDLPSHHTAQSSSSSSTQSNPLEAVLPRRQMYEILDTFYEYVYPLLALPHRPSLLADIARRREEVHPPLPPSTLDLNPNPNSKAGATDHASALRAAEADAEEFTALVLGVVAFTLVQIPHDMIPSLDKPRMRDLVLRCCHVLRPFVAQEHDRPSLDRMTATWCYGTVLNNRGRHMQARALHAGNVVNGLQTGLNDPLSYVSVNPLQQQMHRRMWWNLYMADRSSTFSENGHLLISEDECRDVELPLEVDDEFITPEGILPVPEGRPSVVRGFVGLLRLFRLGGLLLHGRRRDRWERPSGIHLKGRLSELDELLVRIEDFMIDCPPEMRLEIRPPPLATHSGSGAGAGSGSGAGLGSAKTAGTGFGFPNLAEGWETISPSTLRTMRTSSANPRFPNAPFLVQQGNMYVSQQMLRLMVITYRDELRALAHHEAAMVGNKSMVSPTTQALPRPDSTDATDQVMTDLLSVLHSLPTEIHVINSFPGVSKIRFVASTLLTKLENDALLLLDQQSPHEDVAQAKAKEQLLEYLRFLTTIEQMYTLRDET